MLKREKGITIVALVITIIILLILAGITINNALGENGLIKKAKITENQYRTVEIEESEGIKNLIKKLNETKHDKVEEPKAGDVVKKENNIKYTLDGEDNIIPVPEGFSYLEGTKETGFVIKNDTDGNEFVWIPTDLVEYKNYEWTVKTNDHLSSSNFKEYYTSNTTQNNQIISSINESVKNYNGYYIARYEAGITVKRTSTTTPTENPIFQATSEKKIVYSYNYVTWEQAINLSNALYNKENNYVESRLLNNRGWDTALKFIEKIGEDADSIFPTNSLNKGWYTDNKDNNPNHETGKSIDITNKTAPNKLKNIYDLAGNMIEWTAEISNLISNRRAKRGGHYTYKGSEGAAAKRYHHPLSEAMETTGFRIALYL